MGREVRDLDEENENRAIDAIDCEPVLVGT